MPARLTKAQARRIGLAAQGFLDPPHAQPTMRTFDRTIARLGVLQVDSVNVLKRAHYMPLYSRMGPYPEALLDRATSVRERRLVEYWAHVQALMPVELWPVMRHRMAEFRAKRARWTVLDHAPELESSLIAEVRERGASTARDLDDGLPRVRDNWGWNWSRTRQVLDFLYSTGELAIAGRNSQFEVLFDLPQRVLPPEVLAAPTPSLPEAHLELTRRAACSLGVGTVRCLSDYYRMPMTAVKAAVDELVRSGELEPVVIEGWDRPAYLHAAARRPRRVVARALLSPFDPVCWERTRAEQLFGFRYRIEIYVPEPKRVFGYYVLPFLLGDRLVARVDLKADRPRRLLVVKAAHREPEAPGSTARELAVELRRLAGWLELDDVVVEPRGALAAPVSRELAAAGDAFGDPRIRA